MTTQTLIYIFCYIVGVRIAYIAGKSKGYDEFMEEISKRMDEWVEDFAKRFKERRK